MHVSDNKRYLEFNLKDGWRYQERGDESGTQPTEYIRINFKEYKKQFDLSSFQFNRTADSVNKNNERMRSMRQLDYAIDSLEKEVAKIRDRLHTSIFYPFQFVKYFDSSSTTTNSNNELDSLKGKKLTSFIELLPDSVWRNITDRAIAQVNSLKV